MTVRALTYSKVALAAYKFLYRKGFKIYLLKLNLVWELCSKHTEETTHQIMATGDVYLVFSHLF